MANFSNVFSTGKKVPFGLAAASPDLSNMFQGYRNLNINQPVDIYSSAQADWERQRADLLRSGTNDVATVVGLANLGQSPSQQKLDFERRKEEANIARQARKEDIAALIEQKRVYDKEKAERDFTYNTLASIPQAITQTATTAAAMNLAAGQSMQQSAGNILQAYANARFSSAPTYQSRTYFG
jgi:hypothetical protein